jgi:hypothetical protein
MSNVCKQDKNTDLCIRIQNHNDPNLLKGLKWLQPKLC